MGRPDVVDLTQVDSESDRSDTNNDDDVSIVYTIPALKRLKPSPSPPPSTIQTSAYTEVPTQPNTVLVLAEGRSVCSELAFSFIDLTTSKCWVTQYADTASFAHTIYSLTFLRPHTILVPRAMWVGKSKCMRTIRRYLPWASVQMLDRRLFDDGAGMRFVSEMCVPEILPGLRRCLRDKQYTYAAVNALFTYLGQNHDCVYAKASVYFEYRQMEAIPLDPGAWHDLQLTEPSGSRNNKQNCSLLASLKHTHTKMGERLLRANILQPSTDLSTITGRQCAVEDLLDNEDIFFSLSLSLAEFPDIDSVITALVRLPEAKTVRQATQVINNVLHVKHVLETSLAIAGSLNGAVQSELLCEIATSLGDLRAGELLAVIHAVVRADIQVEKSAQAIRSQRCHMVKDSVDGFLDVSRSIFDAVSQQVIDLVEQYANELQISIKAVYRPNIGYIMSCRSDCFSDGVPEEFLNFVRKKSQCTFTTLDLVKLNNRLASVVSEINILTEKAIKSVADTISSNIVLLYKISEAVALLDMLVSFAHLCTTSDYVQPQFSDAISIEDGRHPIIESMGDPVTPNRINTADKTFTIISGPNMGGKSTYLRQVAYMAIMAQIGCYVPARSATFKVFDKLFVRMNNDDSIAEHESSFVREMRDVSYILHTYNQHSLVLIDELGRGTATQEGMAICRAISEELLESHATVFLTTHFLELPHILGEHRNCSRLVLSDPVSARIASI
ncbi:hypothetical protein DL89DRAFT_309902 [Linderina pennispora]|uniref:DNA mismatch repair proteins mutS family domain-containing protein n=1 Tax=Linderina pennispora TaxID=61395 RepID=A0A1Y1VXW5_9FUNG|nr:uncharacterized protein DL89DRAFT_309902 [Linderina pennispora]ORX65856.1 hypothetical protein DL89DRAFT_309902 [Linderina pennispora]